MRGSLTKQRDYSHVFRSGDKALWGHNILDCGGELLQSDECTPERTHIYPIHWNTAEDGSGFSGFGGHPRELRLHPDDVHMGWRSFTGTGGQFCYFGHLQFNPSPEVGLPLAPRYELVNTNLLVHPNGNKPVEIHGDEIKIQHDAITVGEFRGFSGIGDGFNGAVNDPSWNGRADPAFSPDGTLIMFWQSLVVSPSCGGGNPLKCPESTAQGGRTYRVMLARRTSRKPQKQLPVYNAPDTIPWATLFAPDVSAPKDSSL